jgi:hypothetical protein
VPRPTRQGSDEGKTTLLSYNATSARTVNLSIPIVNGIGVSIVGYCRATFRLENGRVAGLTYTGDGDPLGGRNSACGAPASQGEARTTLRFRRTGLVDAVVDRAAALSGRGYNSPAPIR